MKLFAIALLLGTGLAVPAYAADANSNSSQAGTAPAVKHYDFEDDQVEGDLQRPDGLLINSIARAEQKSLIEIPRNFIPEMIKTFEDLE